MHQQNDLGFVCKMDGFGHGGCCNCCHILLPSPKELAPGLPGRWWHDGRVSGSVQDTMCSGEESYGQPHGSVSLLSVMRIIFLKSRIHVYISPLFSLNKFQVCFCVSSFFFKCTFSLNCKC